MTEEQIKQRIQDILSDSRLSSKTARVFTNAPLALIQYGLEVELHTLEKVLGLQLTNIKKLRGEDEIK